MLSLFERLAIWYGSCDPSHKRWMKLAAFCVASLIGIGVGALAFVLLMLSAVYWAFESLLEEHQAVASHRYQENLAVLSELDERMQMFAAETEIRDLNQKQETTQLQEKISALASTAHQIESATAALDQCAKAFEHTSHQMQQTSTFFKATLDQEQEKLNAAYQQMEATDHEIAEILKGYRR